MSIKIYKLTFDCQKIADALWILYAEANSKQAGRTGHIKETLEKVRR